MIVTRTTFTGILLGLVAISGCGERALTEQQRMEKNLGQSLKTVVPLAGTVTVDGKPQKTVVIKLFKSDNLESQLPNSFTTADPEEGKFAFMTYKEGDGVEPGEYVVTFELMKAKSGGRFEGPDRLNDRYNDPKSSQFPIKLVAGEPQKELKFELTTR